MSQDINVSSKILVRSLLWIGHFQVNQRVSRAARFIYHIDQEGVRYLINRLLSGVYQSTVNHIHRQYLIVEKVISKTRPRL
jgi:hypothetical protein